MLLMKTKFLYLITQQLTPIIITDMSNFDGVNICKCDRILKTWIPKTKTTLMYRIGRNKEGFLTQETA